MKTRKSVPTKEVFSWWDCGWAYVMPDFDKPNHSIIEWLSDQVPAEPVTNRVPSMTGTQGI